MLNVKILLLLLAQGPACGRDDWKWLQKHFKALKSAMCGLKSTDPKHLCLGKFVLTFSTENHCLVVKSITANDMGYDYMCMYVSVSLCVLNVCRRVCVCCVELRYFCARLCMWACVYIKCIVRVYLSVHMLLCKVCSCFYVCVCLHVCAYLSVWDGAASGFWVRVKASLPWGSFKEIFSTQGSSPQLLLWQVDFLPLAPAGKPSSDNRNYVIHGSQFIRDWGC